MTKLVIGSVANHPFAVRADRVEKTVEVRSFSRFMRGQRDDVVAAVIDDRVQFLTDLSVRLGLNGLSQSGRAGLITSPDQQISGVLAQDQPMTINVEDESFLPVSSYVGSSVMEACALIGDQFVPVLSEQFFEALQHSDAVGVWAPSESLLSEGEPTGSFLEVRVGSLHCAFERRGFDDALVDLPQVVPLPFAPARISGLARLNDQMVAVANVGAALGLDGQADAETLIPYRHDELSAYFLVSQYIGREQGREVILPKLLRRAGIGRALETQDEVLPIIAPGAVLGTLPEESITHQTNSEFQDALYKGAVSVTEFSFGDFVYAVPTEELGDEIEAVKSYPFWANHPLIRRVACTGKMILPELDLAGYLGHDSEIARSTPLYVRNGEFEAVFSAERVVGKRALEPREQKPLPAELPHNLVYGCYLDGKEVRLVLNLAAIAEHATDERLQNVLASISNANRAGLTGRRPPKSKIQTAPIPPESDATEIVADQPEPEGEVEPTEPKPELTPEIVAASPQESEPPGERIREPEDEAPVMEGVDETDSMGAPDIELDLEQDELDHEAEASDDEMELEVEPPLTIDPQMASWEREHDHDDEAGTPAAELSHQHDPVLPSDMVAEAEEPPQKKGRRGRAVLLILLLLLATTVGGIYAFQRTLFDRLLAEAEDAVGGVVASVQRMTLPTDDAPRQTPESQASSAGSQGPDVERANEVRVSESAADSEAASDPATDDQNVAQPTVSTDATPPVEFTERVYFAADSAELVPRARETLDEIIDRINEGGRWNIEIIGHVARAQHGTPESFRWLSEQRAKTVRDYLLPRLEAAPLELTLTGMGATEPAAPNDTSSGRALNRRVQVGVEAASE